MGVKGLEKFMAAKENGIATKIHIRDEIRKWRREHGNRTPTIVVDLKEFNRKLGNRENREQSFEYALSQGGRFNIFNDTLHYFFSEIKNANAKLVFIVRLEEGKYKDATAFKQSSLRPNERMLFNLMHSICSKYGQVHVVHGLDKQALLAYSRQNCNNVMAIITRNTEFLSFDDSYEFWSLNDISFKNLTIVKFCRQLLYRRLGMNTKQMQLMVAISELNGTIARKMIKERLRTKAEVKLPMLMTYVKSLPCGPNGYDINDMAANLNENERNALEHEWYIVRAKNNYVENWEQDIYHGVVLNLMNNDESFKSFAEFCQNNIYFAYKLMNETTTVQKDLLFINIEMPYGLLFIDLVITITMKLIGIIFKDVDVDQRPETRTVKFKLNRNEAAAPIERNILYPTMQLPANKNLICDENDHTFDESRWTLLQWLLSLDQDLIYRIMTSEATKFMKIVTLTLEFLLKHKIISAKLADVIRQVELDVQKRRAESHNWQTFYVSFPGKDINPSWVQIGHKYTINFELVCHCLELCGMRKFTDLIQFDCLEFTKSMRKI